MKTFGLLLLVTGLTAAACSHAAPQSPPPVLGQVPTITAVDEVKRPLDRYLLSVDQVKTLIRAEGVATAQCMKGYGLRSLSPDLDEVDREAGYIMTRNRLYGYFDTQDGAYPGYETLGQQDLNGFETLSADQTTALSGRDASGKPAVALNGKLLPPGGCDQIGLDAIGGIPPRLDEKTLPDGGPQVPVSDPRLVSVYALWSSCMRGKGYSYTTPVAALGDPQWNPGPNADPKTYQPSVLEKATVAADVECKRTTNLVGTAVAVQSAYDEQYIASHSAALADYRRKVDADLAAANRILAR